MAEVMPLDVVDIVSRKLGSVDLSEDDKENSRGSAIVLNAVPRELVMVDRSKDGNVKKSFVRSVVQKDKKLIDLSTESRYSLHCRTDDAQGMFHIELFHVELVH